MGYVRGVYVLWGVICVLSGTLSVCSVSESG